MFKPKYYIQLQSTFNLLPPIKFTQKFAVIKIMFILIVFQELTIDVSISSMFNLKKLYISWFRGQGRETRMAWKWYGKMGLK